MNNQKLSLSAITLITLLITTVAVPQAFAREGGVVYTGESSSSFITQNDPNACDTLVGQPGQCAVFPDATNLPDPILAVILAQGGDILNPTGCEVVVISSGNVLDIGPTLSTSMLGATCMDAAGNPETNPEGFVTNDCATINLTPDLDALIFYRTVEGDFFIGSNFFTVDIIVF